MFNKKKKFFKEKIDAVTKTMWEVEFKLTKSRLVREGVRLDRDRSVEALQIINTSIEREKDEEKKKQFENEKLSVQENIKRYEAQMEMIDKQINGFTGDETHESVIGLIEQLKSYTELILMYKEHINTL